MKRLRVERDPQRREQIIKLGRKALMRWFLVGAKNLLKGVIPLNRRDEQFVARYRADLKIIGSKRFSDEDRKHFSREGVLDFLGESSFVICSSGMKLRKEEKEILWLREEELQAQTAP